MKIIRKEFEIEEAVLLNGEPVINTEKKVLYFAMDLKAHKMIENALGKPLINLFSGKSQEEITATMMSADVMLTLASACYLDVEDGYVKHDEVTMEQFKKSKYAQVAMNQDLIFELSMAIADYFGANKKQAEVSNKKSKEKK